MDIHYIHYYYVFDNEISKSTFVLPNEFEDSRLLELGLFPHSFEHVVYGCQFYEDILLSPMHSGYCVEFVKYDNDFDFSRFKVKNYKVFLIFSKESQSFVDKLISTNIKDFVCVNYSTIQICNMNVFNSSKAAIKHLKEIALNFVSKDLNKKEFFLYNWDSEIKNDYKFDATYVNTLISHSIMGNFDYDKEFTYDNNNCNDTQQNILIEQIELINKFETHVLNLLYELTSNNKFINNKQSRLNKCIKQNPKQEFFNFIYGTEEDLLFTMVQKQKNIIETLKEILSAPVIISMPYMSKYAMTKIKRSTGLSYKTFKFKTSIDYKFYSKSTEQNKLFKARSIFNDYLALINASHRFSPYIRLPFIGNENNKTLGFPSFDSAKIVQKIIEGDSSIEIENIISDELKQYLLNCSKQIVAISDFPIEWLAIDGVPLCFTNDICRIPELPYNNAVNQTIQATNVNYIVPNDILQHTLVIFGNDDTDFKEWQVKFPDIFKVQLFKTVRCNNKKEFFDTINKYSPQLLIIDSHGGEEDENTVICIGDDIIFPDDIVKNIKTNIPLVYLSCCSLNPLIKNYNSVANAFIEAGSISVSSSLLPLDIEESSITYIRLLYMLSHIKEMPYFANWLAFISHINRTSYCTSIIEMQLSPTISNELKNEATKENARNKVTKNGDEFREIGKKLLHYENRRSVFQKMKYIYEARLSRKKDKLFPHFLRTLNLGRGDLVFFEANDE